MNEKPHRSDAVAQLSDGQKACLRGVLALQSSKQIAATLGISLHTVDKRLKDAMRLLDASSRNAAAIQFAKAENIEYQGLVSQSPALSTFVETVQSLSPARELATHLAEDRAVFQPVPFDAVADALVPKNRRQPDDLTILQRLTIIAVVALGAPLLVGALASALSLAQSFYTAR